MPLTKRFESIQALRALAAIGVVAYHVNGNTAAAGWSTSWFHILSLYGVMGVDVFFVVSGFVMAMVTTDLMPGPQTALAFMKARIKRVVPMYWAMTALFIALALIAPAALVYEPLNLSKAVTSFLFIPQTNEAGKVEPVLYVGWTLYYEMWFYLVFAVALRFFRHSLVAVTVFLVLTSIAALAGAHGALLSTYTNPIVLEFVAGAWLGAFYARERNVPVWNAAILVLLALGSHQVLRPVLTDANRFWVFGIPAFTFVTLFLSLERRLRWGVLLPLGDASYSIYLTHVFGVPIGLKLLMLVDPARRLHGDPVCVAVALISLGVGLIAYRWIERPMSRTLSSYRKSQDAQRETA